MPPFMFFLTLYYIGEGRYYALFMFFLHSAESSFEWKQHLFLDNLVAFCLSFIWKNLNAGVQTKLYLLLINTL